MIADPRIAERRMGHGDGRPGTPGLDNRASEETRAGFSGAIVLVAIISFVMSVIALAIPYWGVFRPQSGNLKFQIFFPLKISQLPYSLRCRVEYILGVIQHIIDHPRVRNRVK